MQQIRFQNTIEHMARVSGRGYWSGRPITLTFLPSSPNTGIIFRRVDLAGRPEIQSIASNRRDTSLRTTLVGEDCHVEMVEHVAAALYAMEIDNCIVECDAPEMPGMDGSALAFAIALDRSGIRKQPATTTDVSIMMPVRVGTDQQWIMAMPSSDPGLTIQYQLDYGPGSPIPASTTTYKLETWIVLRINRTCENFPDRKRSPRSSVARGRFARYLSRSRCVWTKRSDRYDTKIQRRMLSPQIIRPHR